MKDTSIMSFLEKKYGREAANIIKDYDAKKAIYTKDK